MVEKEIPENLKADADIKAASNLNSMSLKTLPIGSRELEVACQQINTSLLKYNASKDYLSSAEFMCNMIDGIMSETSPQIVKICRGSETFVETKKLSEIKIRRNALAVSQRISKAFSMNSFAYLLEKKAKELQCPDASSPLIYN